MFQPIFFLILLSFLVDLTFGYFCQVCSAPSGQTCCYYYSYSNYDYYCSSYTYCLGISSNFCNGTSYCPSSGSSSGGSSSGGSSSGGSSYTSPTIDCAYWVTFLNNANTSDKYVAVPLALYQALEAIGIILCVVAFIIMLFLIARKFWKPKNKVLQPMTVQTNTMGQMMSPGYLGQMNAVGQMNGQTNNVGQMTTDGRLNDQTKTGVGNL